MYDFLSAFLLGQDTSARTHRPGICQLAGVWLVRRQTQIGMARVVTDFSIVAYLCDVFIHEDYRGQGLGKWLIQSIFEHPDLKHVAAGCLPQTMRMAYINNLVLNNCPK